MTPTAQLAAVAKDEGPYVREWVAHHRRVCGFQEVVVYDNDSSDDTRRELESMAAEGLCEWRDWPRSLHNPPQQTAYGDALAKCRADWLCLLDVDEFLVINSGESVPEFLMSFAEDVGAVSFNWAVFYSLDNKPSPGPVTERVRYCYGDPHVKTVARRKAARGCFIHTFDLLPGYRHLHCSGVEYPPGPHDLPLDARVCSLPEFQVLDWDRAQVNHYLMKSLEETLAKDLRGRASTADYTKKDLSSFHRRIMRMSEHRENGALRRYVERREGKAK